LAVGVTFRVLKIFMGPSWQPRLVCFTHPKPASLPVHRRLFGRAVEFGHQFSGIVCNAADLDVPNPGADAVMVRYAQRLLEQTLDTSSRMSDRVKQLVVLLLPRGCAASRWLRSTWVWIDARWRVNWPTSKPRSRRSSTTCAATSLRGT
jgi:hypothetical protein